MTKPMTPNEAYMSRVRQIFANAHPPKIVRHAGQLNEVEVEGKKFQRQEHIYIPTMEMLVKCAPTDNHFIFRDARHLGWTLFCTCGSPAVVVGYDAYKELGSNSGAMLVCFVQTTDPSHRHADGSS